MLATFLATLEQMCRILLLLSIGFLFNKFRLVPHAAEGVLSRFVTMLFLPCLCLYSNIIESNVQSLSANAGLVLLGTVICLAGMALSYPLARLLGGKDEYARGIYRYALSFPNTGAVSMPLILAFFGTSGLFQYNLFWFASSVLCYAWGVAQMQPSHGRQSFSSGLLKSLNTATISTVLGMLLGVLGAKNWMPPIVLRTMGELGDCYVITGLLLVGYSVADYPFGKVFGNWRTWVFTAIRLVIFPGIVLLVLVLCNAPQFTCVLAALVYAGPCGMNVVIYPAAYGENCETGAGMVLLSSLCSVITIPVIYSLVQHLAA